MKTIAFISLSIFLLAAAAYPETCGAQKELDDKVLEAVNASQVPVLAEWMANGGDIDRATKAGNTLLILASKIGDRQVIEYLLTQYPDLDAQNKAGATALMIAAKYGQLHVVERLLEQGANPKIINNYGLSAARFALDFDHLEIYDRLVEAERKFS